MTFFDYLKNIFFILIILQIAPVLIENIAKQYRKYLEPRTRVAVLPIKGVLYSSSSYNKKLRAFFEDTSIRAIIIKMECPGSAAGTGQSIFNELLALKKETPKPVVVLVENICASGGYNIACAADYIIAPASAIIGSIGTSLPYLFKVNRLLSQWNVDYSAVAAGEYKNLTNPFVPATPEDTELLQGLTEDSYQQFLLDVSQNRKLSLANAKEWGNGKIFTGNQALKLGLIDAIGSLDNAIKIIKEKALIEGKIEWVHPLKKSSLWSFFSGDSAHENDSMYASLSNKICDTIEQRFFNPQSR